MQRLLGGALCELCAVCLPLALFHLAQSLVGLHLSAFLNVFRDYKKQNGDETGLLTALGMRVLEGAADDAWRVGVLQPKSGDREQVGLLARILSTCHAAAARWRQLQLRCVIACRRLYHCVPSLGWFSHARCAPPAHPQADVATSALAAALQQRNRERAALMSVTVRADEEGGAASAPAAPAGGVLALTSGGEGSERAALDVVLWRADAVAAVLEVDGQLEVSRADAAAGLLFGVAHRALLKKDFRK